MSESQLEAFLVTVNGGSLEPDSDDDLAMELFGNDLAIQVPPREGLKSVKHTKASEADFSNITNQVLITLLERCISKPKRGRRTKKSLMDENRAKERAQQVEDLLRDIDIGNGQVFNDAKLQAISEFCSRLRSFKKTGSFGEEDLIMPPIEARSPPSPNYIPTIVSPDSVVVGPKVTVNGDSVLPGNSPVAALHLPNATNPFADDDMAIPTASHSVHPPPPSRGFPTTEAQFHALKATRAVHQQPLNILDPQIPSYGTYPQFRPVSTLGTFHQ